MAYQALYRAWRPETFSEIVDQDAVVRTLRRQVETGHIGHAYLFCGTRGTGKTTAAKVFSRAVNCLNPDHGDPCGQCEVCRAILDETCMDVLEIDAASNNSVDEIRELREKIKYPPTLAKYKVYIIDEVHMLSSGAFNALLKTLEEPPKHAIFILATTEPQKLLATILSRCQRFDFHRISVDAIVSRLQVVLAGIGREAENNALLEIARAAEGAMRDALSLLDVCLSFTDGIVTEDLAREVLGTTGRAFMFDFTNALISFDVSTVLKLIDDAMRRGNDPRVFAADAAAHLRAILLADTVGDALTSILEVTPEDAALFADQAKKCNREQVMRSMELFMHVDGEAKRVSQPRTALELAAVRACHPEHELNTSADERLARVEALIKNGIAVQPVRNAETEKPEKKAAASVTEQKNTSASSTEPAAAPPQEYLTAIEQIGAENSAICGMLPKVKFAGYENDVVFIELGSDGKLLIKFLETKSNVFEAAFTEAFGKPTRVRFFIAGSQFPIRMAQGTKGSVEQSFDVFGRENIILSD